MSELGSMWPDVQLWPPRELLAAASGSLSAAETPGLPTLLIGGGVVLLLLPRLRQAVFDTVETVLASLLLVVLIAAVVGLPFGESRRCCLASAAVCRCEPSASKALTAPRPVPPPAAARAAQPPRTSRSRAPPGR